MRALKNKPNVVAPTPEYPYGRIRDDDGSGNGTNVDEDAYGDMHQFFERLMAQAGVSPNEHPDGAYTGFQLFEALYNNLMGGMRRKTLQIGDWNMDTTLSRFVAHGLPDPKKIRTIQVIIRNDADNAYDDILIDGGTINGISTWIVSTIQLFRANAGRFDNAGYSATGYNRGWITISYEQ